MGGNQAWVGISFYRKKSQLGLIDQLTTILSAINEARWQCYLTKLVVSEMRLKQISKLQPHHWNGGIARTRNSRMKTASPCVRGLFFAICMVHRRVFSFSIFIDLVFLKREQRELLAMVVGSKLAKSDFFVIIYLISIYFVHRSSSSHCYIYFCFIFGCL